MRKWMKLGNLTMEICGKSKTFTACELENHYLSVNQRTKWAIFNSKLSNCQRASLFNLAAWM